MIGDLTRCTYVSYVSISRLEPLVHTLHTIRQFCVTSVEL